MVVLISCLFIVCTIFLVSDFLWRGDSECCYLVWFALVEVGFSSFSFLLFILFCALVLAPSCLISSIDDFVDAIPYLVVRLC